MDLRRLFALAFSIVGVLGVSGVLAQKEEPAPASRTLEPEVVSLRILLGVGDTQSRPWGGKVKVDKGEVTNVEGYRFRKGDRVSGKDSWEAKNPLVRKNAAKKAFAKKAAAKGQAVAAAGPGYAPTGVIVGVKAPEDATLSVETEGGKFEVKLADVAGGKPQKFLSGKAEVQRVATGIPLQDGQEQADFPAAATDNAGTTWIAYVEHQPRGDDVLESFKDRPKDFASSRPEGGGDQVRLIRFKDGKADEPINVTAAGLDVWRPAVALAADGSVVVAWSENNEGNWDLHRKRYDPAAKTWSEPKRLTSDPGADTDVVLAAGPEGAVWAAWQAWREGKARILFGPVEGLDQALAVNQIPGNQWSPSLAVDRQGKVHIAYDTYAKGNYDVLLYSYDPGAKAGREIVVAGSSRYEARPSVAVDAKGNAWVAFEERTSNWGKDAENLLKGEGSTLYRSADVKVRRVEGDRVFDAPDPVAGEPYTLREMNSYPRLTVDRDGRVWLAFRHRQEAVWGNNAVMVVGGVWLEYATSLAGKAWDPVQFLPRSDGLLDNRPALVVPSQGPALIVYSSDGRLRREVEFSPELTRRYWAQSGTPGIPNGVFNEDLQIATLTPVGPKLATVEPVADVPYALRGAADNVPAVHADEQGDIDRMRNHRVAIGGKNYRLVRGDFHRHTEISQDGGNDGSAEDMWRYAIDAAQLDWIGFGDHDNGGGKEYTWWLSQKLTDLYKSPSMVTLFTYERSVVYPHGHRNVMFPKRGIRTLPRLVGDAGVVDEDTLMLYDYLKEHGGICASHTTATGMGTDWRDVNPEFEPMVEIFQGHRNSYEHLGAPRVARRPGEAIGGWRPLGMVWNALAMQYRLGYLASSDHVSTHISYAVAVAEDFTREAVFDAFKRRHCYGATDNIVLDVRSGNHLMGDEFTAQGPVSLKVLVHGTKPIARVDIIKDFVYVFSTEPKQVRVEFDWTDSEKRPGGLSWYYVRAIQEDGELAWASPFWVRFPAGDVEE
ncbi:hypothetical protein [Singulisphaera sp. PoT]|uniref:hypothetical protein n=1 Tax=Singulisphaera sp. PoT TaxID=3411797 RepID=UPI003BF53EF9